MSPIRRHRETTRLGLNVQEVTVTLSADQNLLSPSLCVFALSLRIHTFTNKGSYSGSPVSLSWFLVSISTVRRPDPPPASSPPSFIGEYNTTIVAVPPHIVPKIMADIRSQQRVQLRKRQESRRQDADMTTSSQTLIAISKHPNSRDEVDKLTKSRQPSENQSNSRSADDHWHGRGNDDETRYRLRNRGGRFLPKSAASLLRREYHFVLAGEKDCKVFVHMMSYPGANLHAVRMLEIHFDATKLDEFAEYRFSLVLNGLQPLSNGTNPHNLKAIRLVIKGNVLFTRYSYHLASPALSKDVNGDLERLIRDVLSNSEKDQLDYKVISTERGIANALLGIRGVRQIVIEGKGTMEGSFAETIKATLNQSPGTAIIESEGSTQLSLTPEMSVIGEIYSRAYRQRSERPYPTRGEAKYDVSSLLDKDQYSVDDQDQLLNDIRGDPVTNRSVPIPMSALPRSRKTTQEVEVDDPTEARLVRQGRSTKKQNPAGKLGLGLEDMVRIHIRKQDSEDGVLKRVELGWKV